MELVSSECIILRAQDFAERDRLISFFTPEAGRLRGIVKGSRKLTSRGVGSFEPFSRGVMHYVPKAEGLVTIRKCDPHPPYLVLQGDYHRILYAGYLAELVDLCTIEPAEAAPYFDLLAGTLDALCEEGPARRLPLLRLRFELRHLELLGYAPDWRRCCGCGQALLREGADGVAEAVLHAPHRFDLNQGGVRCPDCMVRGSGPALSPQALAFLENWRNALPGAAARATRPVLEELEQAITRHLTHRLERQPRSLALLPSLAEFDAETAG